MSLLNYISFNNHIKRDIYLSVLKRNQYFDEQYHGVHVFQLFHLDIVSS